MWLGIKMARARDVARARMWLGLEMAVIWL